jgi:hypothetical protein
MPLRPKLFVDFHIGRISVRLGIEFKSRMTRRSFRFVQYHVERPRGSRSRACRAIIRSPAFSGGGLLAFVVTSSRPIATSGARKKCAEIVALANLFAILAFVSLKPCFLSLSAKSS